MGADPVTKRLWIKLLLLIALLVGVAVFIAMLKGGSMAYESPQDKGIVRDAGPRTNTTST